MNAPTREEFDAKLEILMVRMDGRVASIESKIDALASAMNERFGSLDVRFRAIDERFNRIDERFKGMDERFKSMDDRIGRMETSIGGLRTTILVTGLSAVIAIVLGVAAFNATLLSNMVASFESGKNLGADQAEIKRQTEATAVLLKQMQAQIQPATTPSK